MLQRSPSGITCLSCAGLHRHAASAQMVQCGLLAGALGRAELEEHTFHRQMRLPRTERTKRTWRSADVRWTADGHISLRMEVLRAKDSIPRAGASPLPVICIQRNSRSASSEQDGLQITNRSQDVSRGQATHQGHVPVLYPTLRRAQDVPTGSSSKEEGQLRLLPIVTVHLQSMRLKALLAASWRELLLEILWASCRQNRKKNGRNLEICRQTTCRSWRVLSIIAMTQDTG